MAAKRPPMRRGNSARPLLAAALPDIGVDVNEQKSAGLQQLLADVSSVVGGVGGVVPHRPVVVGEADEAGILHARGFGAHRRPQDAFGKRYVLGRTRRRRSARRWPRISDDRPLRATTGSRVRSQRVELFVEVGSGEPSTECVEDVVGVLAASRSRASSLRNTAASSSVELTDPTVANRFGASTATPPSASTVPVRNPMDDRCPSPIPRTLITKRRLPAAAPAWSGWATMLGLHRAAPSMAYSLVNVAPSSNIRADERCMPASRRSASSAAWLRNVPTRSRCRPSKRVTMSSSDRRTSSSSRARMRAITAPVRES